MPYEISWEPLGVAFRFSGVVLDEDSIAASEELYASPLFPTMKYQIIDFSHIEEFALSSTANRKIAEWDQVAAERNPDMKQAVITSAPLVRGMVNVYVAIHEVVGGSWTTRFFEREKDARAWAVPSS